MRAALRAGVLALGVGACASPGIPPGGPPDKEPPQLLAVTPDTNSLNVRTRSVLFRFDEVVNERSSPIGGAGGAGGQRTGGSDGGFGGGGSGVASLAALVLVSPGDGRERVTWRRHAIEVEPRNGFRPNTTYRVTILPGLGDLRGNVLKEPVEVVFSTGATTTTGSISGLVFDWVGNKIVPNARVEVFAPTDSTLRWSARADSAGRFAVRDLAPGSYRLRGWLDADNDRTLDEREVFDSTTVTVDSTVAAELYAFVHDTIGPRIETLEPIDSTGLRLKFDRGIEIGWTPDAATAVLMRSDSTFVRVGTLMPAARFDSLAKAALSAADTVSPAADPADSAARLAATAAAAPARPDTAGVAGDVARTAARAAAARAATADSIAALAPKLNRPVPIQSWVLTFESPLAPGEYRLTVRRVRGLTGVVRDSERVFRLRPPPPPRDTTAARRPPAATTPDGRPAPVRPPATGRPRA